MKITFSKKQTEAILFIISEMIESENYSDDFLDELEQTAIGNHLDSLSDDELAHFGVLGMKWGVRRGFRKLNKLERKTRRFEKRFDRTGKIDKDDLRNINSRYRKYSYRTTKRIRKLTKYLNRDSKTGSTTLSNRFFNIEHDPEQVKLAKQYLNDSEILREKFNNIGRRLDSLKTDALLYGK